MLWLYACTNTLSANKKEYKAADETDINECLSKIEKINTSYPESFFSNFNVEGQSGKQKFKASGNIRFNYSPRKMRIVFHDAVFKTPFLEIIQDNDIVKFYYPIEKKIIIDNVNKIDIKYYTNFNLGSDFKFIYDILTYKIPVIENFSVKKGLRNKNDNSGADSLIILENDYYYETLSFSDNIPDKILCLNKETKEKIEVYLNDPFLIKGILSYKNIRIVSPDSDMKMNMQFSSKKINIPVDPEKLIYIKRLKDVKIYNKE